MLIRQFTYCRHVTDTYAHRFFFKTESITITVLVTRDILLFQSSFDFLFQRIRIQNYPNIHGIFHVNPFLERNCFSEVNSINYVCVSGGKKCQFFKTSCVRTKWMTPCTTRATNMHALSSITSLIAFYLNIRALPKGQM